MLQSPGHLAIEHPLIINMSYYNKGNSFYHGIMFHHFHDEKIHPRSQGSISKDEFYKLINFIGRQNILDAHVFIERYKEKKLKENEVCLTFDDAIKCQIDVALPVLEDLKIKSFFFVYTSIFDGKPDNLEIFRFFRTNFFKSINNFYDEFYKQMNEKLEVFFNSKKRLIDEKKIKHPTYSIEDIKFRLVRDLFLKKEDYEKIMSEMMKKKKFNPSKYYSNLFFNKDDLKSLSSLNHTIGIHSHHHHTLIESLNYNEQKYEYETCLSNISRILNVPKENIKSMSHPCGSYNQDTLSILKNLGIELGFKQIMKVEPERGMKKINNSNLEIARQNHSEIMKKIL